MSVSRQLNWDHLSEWLERHFQAVEGEFDEQGKWSRKECPRDASPHFIISRSDGLPQATALAYERAGPRTGVQ
jgi:hypothetical protein